MVERQRVQRLLASAGLASRRKSEDLVRQGRVKVNDRIAFLGDSAIIGEDVVTVDGINVMSERKRYLIFNKPPGYVTTMSKKHGQDSVMKFIDVVERVFPSGRLDRDTQGLLVFTNDGSFSNRLTHPRYQIKKTYQVELDKYFGEKELKIIRLGLTLDDGFVKPLNVKRLSKNQSMPVIIEVIMTIGRKRIIRRMFSVLGFKVISLKRTSIGPLKLRDLRVATWRDITDEEILSVRKASKI